MFAMYPTFFVFSSEMEIFNTRWQGQGIIVYNIHRYCHSLKERFYRVINSQILPSYMPTPLQSTIAIWYFVHLIHITFQVQTTQISIFFQVKNSTSEYSYVFKTNDNKLHVHLDNNNCPTDGAIVNFVRLNN